MLSEESRSSCAGLIDLWLVFDLTQSCYNNVRNTTELWQTDVLVAHGVRL